MWFYSKFKICFSHFSKVSFKLFLHIFLSIFIQTLFFILNKFFINFLCIKYFYFLQSKTFDWVSQIETFNHQNFANTSENSPTKKPRRPGKSAQISRDPGERYTAQAFRSKSRSRQRFGTTDLKLDMSILLKIQTETRSVFETTKSEKERKREHSARALYKRKLMDKILDRDLVYNEEYKKIDIAERNTKFFQCEVAWASQKTGGIAEMFREILIFVFFLGSIKWFFSRFPNFFE